MLHSFFVNSWLSISIPRQKGMINATRLSRERSEHWRGAGGEVDRRKNISLRNA